MPAQTVIPSDHPMMLAWEAYKASDEYANSFKWAALDEHRAGSMWAAFYAGYESAKHPKTDGEVITIYGMDVREEIYDEICDALGKIMDTESALREKVSPPESVLQCAARAALQVIDAYRLGANQ